jgi:hypothetical protein
MVCATFWAIFLQSHLVTVPTAQKYGTKPMAMVPGCILCTCRFVKVEKENRENRRQIFMLKFQSMFLDYSLGRKRPLRRAPVSMPQLLKPI